MNTYACVQTPTHMCISAAQGSVHTLDHISWGWVIGQVEEDCVGKPVLNAGKGWGAAERLGGLFYFGGYAQEYPAADSVLGGLLLVVSVHHEVMA